MSADEKEFYRKAKRRYTIGAQEEETNEDRLATEEFLKLAGLR